MKHWLRVLWALGCAVALVALACSPPPVKIRRCDAPPKYSLRFGVDAGPLDDAGFYHGDCTFICEGNTPAWAWVCRPATDAGGGAVECVREFDCID